MRLHLDANAIIYSVEGPPGFQGGVSRWVRQVEEIDTTAIYTCAVIPGRRAAVARSHRREGRDWCQNEGANGHRGEDRLLSHHQGP